MSNSFRIDATELLAWHSAIAKRTELRGVPAIAKEIEAHLARKEPDGTVAVTRHQLFTWSEALQGAAARDAAQTLPPVIAEMRAILAGKPAGAAPVAPAAPVLYAPPAPAPTSATSPPPVVYTRAAPSASTQGSVLTGPALAGAIQRMIAGATSEVCVSSPWPTGVETLVKDLDALPLSVRVLVLSRRPDRDDAAFHQAMDQLGKRRAVTAWSPLIQTRMVIVDGSQAIVGAASVPGANSREIGLLVTDATTVRELKAAFERAHQEAAGGRY